MIVLGVLLGATGWKNPRPERQSYCFFELNHGELDSRIFKQNLDFKHIKQFAYKGERA